MSDNKNSNLNQNSEKNHDDSHGDPVESANSTESEPEINPEIQSDPSSENEQDTEQETETASENTLGVSSSEKTSKKPPSSKSEGNNKPNILIVGAASRLAQMLCKQLSTRYNVTGIDVDPIDDISKFPGKFHQIGYTKRGVAEIFKSNDFTSLIHLGRIPAASEKSSGKRYRENVAGTQNLLRLGLNHGVTNFVILSTHLIYGASRMNHLYIREEEPSNAARKFTVLADSIELDHEATEFLWQQRSVRTIVLRPTFVVGKHVDQALVKAFRAPACPKIMGFDPLIQVIHETDLIKAILLALRKKKRGIYNVSGEGVIPFSKAIQLAGGIPLPIPLFVLKNSRLLFKLLGWTVPPHLLDYFKYPVVVSDQAFREEFGYEPEVLTTDALRDL